MDQVVQTTAALLEIWLQPNPSCHPSTRTAEIYSAFNDGGNIFLLSSSFSFLIWLIKMSLFTQSPSKLHILKNLFFSDVAPFYDLSHFTFISTGHTDIVCLNFYLSWWKTMMMLMLMRRMMSKMSEMIMSTMLAMTTQMMWATMI